jgi:hypothetical protein
MCECYDEYMGARWSTPRWPCGGVGDPKPSNAWLGGVAHQPLVAATGMSK